MTAVDVAHLLYSPSALRKVRDILAALCGRADFAGDAYLYRFPMPKTQAGNPERIYTLGKRGRDFIEAESGVKASWRVRPDREMGLWFSQLMHNLVLTRILVCARRFGRGVSWFRVSGMRICYELGGEAVSSDDERTGKRGRDRDKDKDKASVIPDGWILFEKAGKAGGVETRFPVMVEIDRGSMYRVRFKKHVVDRIEFVRSGGYGEMFGVEAVLICYVSTGAMGEYREGRRKALCEWTMEALRDIGRENWASVFRFCSVSYGELYESGVRFLRPS